MQKHRYQYERDGQIDFFDAYNIDYKKQPVLVDNTDGIYHGNLLEFKLSINNAGTVLFQALKYLSHLRLKGKPVPARIILIDLNDTQAYIYNSSDYQADIETVYAGAASDSNTAFHGKTEPAAQYDYSDGTGLIELMKLLVNQSSSNETIYDGTPADWYLPVHIDENCIVGYANTYYAHNPAATKTKFIGKKGEIRNPAFFKGVLIPYTGETNVRFAYLMDCLNDRLKKKDLGAFYTPPEYAEKAAELVLKAIENVPDGNDYVIIDRCAGTGNLEEALLDKTDTKGDSVIAHCIVSTIEYYEYQVLLEKLGDKVRAVIPASQDDIDFQDGLIANADAMSQKFVQNKIIKSYIDDEHCTIILFENPPYRDTSSNATGKGKKQDSFVLQKMSKDGIKGAKLNELSDRFIWSAWKYYLRKPEDSYIVFSPVKYFKTDGLSDKKCIDGFLFNRKHFHATESAISCILWQNIDASYESLTLHAYDIEQQNVKYIKDITIRKAHSVFSDSLYDKRAFPDDTADGVCCNLDGTERADTKNIACKKLYNENIIGYIRASSSNFDPLSRELLRCAEYDGHGFFIRKDNVLNALPLWVAKYFPMDEWYDKGIYATTADAGTAYQKDNDFLKSCLIYAGLSNQNKCLSFTGSDGRIYSNELCFDPQHKETVGNQLLSQFQLDDEEEELFGIWNLTFRQVMRIDKLPEETADMTRKVPLSDNACYHPEIAYGAYQIGKELNTSYQSMHGRSMKTTYDHPMLNTYLVNLRTLLKEYYASHIADKMLQYELVK